MNTLTTTCCIVGGGPAGMILGFLLARAGVEIVVLEKHSDFLRDFRGDTIHPSTLELLHELGILDELLKLPHQELKQLNGQVENVTIPIADFSHLTTKCKFIALMLQWEFLNFIAKQAKKYSTFTLLMDAKVVELIEVKDKIIGVILQQEGELVEIKADLSIGADGRQSDVRSLSGLEVSSSNVPIDVLWMRLSRKSTDPNETFGRFSRGRILVLLNRDDYWQCAMVIPKGELVNIKSKGLESFQKEFGQLVPYLYDRTYELKSWDDIKLLTVRVDRLKKWFKPGLLCIGDAAHAMSPIGGVGINLAIQDAVAAANILWKPLLNKNVTLNDLAKLQKRRELPTILTQKMQIFMQDNVISKAFESNIGSMIPWPFQLLKRFPVLRRIPARVVGIGFRPEHIHSPNSSQLE